MKHFGKCHICGKECELTFEHFPPRSCSNNKPIKSFKYDKDIGFNPFLFTQRYKSLQSGFGKYTLCSVCNTKTAHNYVADYKNWSELISHISMKPGIKCYNLAIENISTLGIIKQIVVMFFSANRPDFRDKHSELLDFILNPQKTDLPQNYKIFTYLTYSNRIRVSAISAKINPLSMSTSIFSEIVFPPVGYILSINSEPPDQRVSDISNFSLVPYRKKTDVDLVLNLLPTFSKLPGDFRSEDEFRRIKL